MSHINTKCIQEGWQPQNGDPRVLPIYQSTTFQYDSAETMGNLFDLTASGHFYTRLSNPTLEAVENKIAALEGGIGAMLTSSGQAASMISVLNLCHAGDHFLCASEIYGGTFNLFHKTTREMGIDVTFFDASASNDDVEALIRDNTKCIFGETLSNPSLRILDIERFAALAHRHGIPLIVDNTFPTPIHCRPFEYGADIVVHSTTKYMDGHACAVGGVVVDSGKFDWTRSGKFPQFTTPDDTYHGTVYAEQFGAAAYIVKARTHLMRDIGAQAAPMNAFLVNLGLETLALRMERHTQNACAVAEFLKKSDKVAWVNYPGMPDYPDHALAQKYLPDGSSGVVSVGFKGGREVAAHFMESLKLARIVIHVADARTCVLHPASTTHRQLTDEQLLACGVKPEMVRMSVGIEYVGDILSDIEQALARL